MKRLILSLLVLSGCATNSGVLLQWPASPTASVEYGTYLDKFPQEYEFEVDAAKLVNNPREYHAIIESLKAVKLPDQMPLITTVSQKSNGNLEVKSIAVEPVYSGEPANEEEAAERRLQKRP